MARARPVWLAICLAIYSMPFGPAIAGEPPRAARTLAPGTILAPSDLAGDPTPAAAERLLGLEVRRAIYAGRPVTVDALGPPTLVERNAIVMMEYHRGALAIRAEGRALEAGAAGDRVRVMNLDSRITVTATVAGRGRVEVTP